MPARNDNGRVTKLEKNKPVGKCRKWMLTVSLGKDPASGKYVRKSKRFNGTYTEANEALVDFVKRIKDAAAGFDPTGKGYTYSEYVELFMEIRKSSDSVAHGTVKRDRDKLDSLGFIIGDLDLNEITPSVLENAYSDLRSGKSKSGKRLSGTYVSDIHKKVSLMMGHAYKSGIIKSNPCEPIVPPKPDTKAKRSLPDKALKKLIKKLNPADPMQCGVLLCATLGLRRGEVVGISVEDLDMDKRTIHICHSFDDDGNLNEPKTKASDRILPLPNIVWEALGVRLRIISALFEQYAPDLIEKSENGDDPKIRPEAPIICTPIGNRIHPSGLGQWWYKNRSSYGLDGWTLHELRHTFLTIAAERGVHPSVMQKLAGHSTSRITMDVYTHVNMNAQREAMESLNEAFIAGSN